MSADNFLFVRHDLKVEDRSDSQPDLPGPVIHEGTDVDEVAEWCAKYMEENFVEYGVEWEGTKP